MILSLLPDISNQDVFECLYPFGNKVKASDFRGSSLQYKPLIERMYLEIVQRF